MGTPGVLFAANEKCKEIRQAEVEGREFLAPNSKYGDLKSAIVQQGLIDAVKQTLGTEIRHRASLATTQTDDQVSDRHKELSYEKARGNVRSYKVIKEDVQKMGEAMVLVITMSVEVCVPDESQLQSMVSVGEFKMQDGRREPNMRPVMEASFPASEQFVLAPGDNEEIPYDILVSGQLVSFNCVRENNATAVTAKILGSFLRGPVGGGVRNIGNSVDQQVQTVKAIITLSALRMAENETVSETVEISRKLKLNAKPESVREEMVTEGIEKGMQRLALKLANGNNE